MEGGSIAACRPSPSSSRRWTKPARERTPPARLPHPMIVKTPKIGPDRQSAVENISRQLNLGASGIMFVETESADEVRQGLAAMRFKSKGGTRPDDVGTAPRTGA